MRIHTLLAAGAFAVTLTACYPDELVNVEDLDTVTTLFDENANFATPRTFVVPDTIVVLADSTDPNPPTVSAGMKAAVIPAVKANMIAAGYVEALNPATNPPDLVAVVNATSSTYSGYVIYDWWYYWGWYPSWGYPPSWGWGYPPSYAYSYTVGTLLVQLVDRQSATAQKIPVIWIAGVNGVIASNEINRAVNGIDQAFKQSPYLHR